MSLQGHKAVPLVRLERQPLDLPMTGLENSTRPLVFTSTSGCRASGNFDIFSENYFFLIYVNNFCDAGQVPIFRYFEA